MALDARLADTLAGAGHDWRGPLPDVGRTVRAGRKKELAVTRHPDRVLVHDFRTGFGACLRDDGSTSALSADELRRLSAERDRAERLERAAGRERQRGAIERVRAEYAAAAPCTAHAYLAAKGVAAMPGLRVDRRGRLLVPRRDVSGRLVALQRIGPDGAKRYSAGTPTRGTLFGIGRVAPEGTVLVAEGLATGLTVHAETGHPCAVAFDAGNLEPVARALRARHPQADLVIAGDDDLATEGNPGRTAALAAARAVGGRALLPRLCPGCACTDHNDAAACRRGDR